MIFNIYCYLHNFSLSSKIIDILSWLYRLLIVAPIEESMLQNIEGVSNYNIPISWFSGKKKYGISGVARLKNAEDFLEKVIESHIDFLNEIILIDNMSTDNTLEICKELQRKYPEKIKFYSYEYQVIPPLSKNPPPTNSIHSLAYYYNWCFAKTSYKYVMKIDDDNFMIPEKFTEIRDFILQKQTKKFCVFFGINLIKNEEKLFVSGESPFSGKFGDCGIYAPSEKTYYIQGKDFEIFKNPYLYKRFGLSYLHLKYLKKNMGCNNYGDGDERFLETQKFSSFLPISDFIKSKEVFESLKKKLDL